MGLSASQAREFFFINRNNQISGMLQRFANDKVDLARDSERVARKYHQALNQNSFKWTNNGGSSYMDITYNSLMKPSAMNQNNAYLLTDTNGKIVIDNSYKKYAELISPDGRPGGDYESNRTQILSALTGLSEEDIENQFISGWQNFEQQTTVDNLLANKPEYPGYKAYTAEQLLGKLNSTSTLVGSLTHPVLNARALQTAYTNSKEIDLGTGTYASSNLDALFNQLKGICNFFTEEDKTKLETVFDNKLKEYKGLLSSSNEKGPVLYKKDGRYKIVVKELVNELLASAPIKEAAYESATNVIRYKCVDSQEAYNTWKNTEYAEWEAQYNQAVANQKTTSDTNQQIFTADIEGQIKFYDALFSSIVDKGWVYNNQVSDSDYLNQCLQNNVFTITTVTTSLEYDSSKTVSENKTTYDFTFWWDNSYEESIASNFDHMILMNDENAEEEALAEFEREKSIISQKEARIDRKMEELQTELAANKQMIEGIQKVKNDNIERNFSIFG